MPRLPILLLPLLLLACAPSGDPSPHSTRSVVNVTAAQIREVLAVSSAQSLHLPEVVLPTLPEPLNPRDPCGGPAGICIPDDFSVPPTAPSPATLRQIALLGTGCGPNAYCTKEEAYTVSTAWMKDMIDLQWLILRGLCARAKCDQSIFVSHDPKVIALMKKACTLTACDTPRVVVDLCVVAKCVDPTLTSDESGDPEHPKSCDDECLEKRRELMEVWQEAVETTMRHLEHQKELEREKEKEAKAHAPQSSPPDLQRELDLETLGWSLLASGATVTLADLHLLHTRWDLLSFTRAKDPAVLTTGLFRPGSPWRTPELEQLLSLSGQLSPQTIDLALGVAENTQWLMVEYTTSRYDGYGPLDGYPRTALLSGRPHPALRFARVALKLDGMNQQAEVCATTPGCVQVVDHLLAAGAFKLVAAGLMPSRVPPTRDINDLSNLSE